MLQLKKLDQKVHKEYTDMLADTADRACTLVDNFKTENDKQNKQFQYLEMQGVSLTEDHHKLTQINQDIGARTQIMEGTIGV